jgi:hypothetical protein
MTWDSFDRPDSIYCATLNGEPVESIHYRQNGRARVRLGDAVGDAKAERLRASRALLRRLLLLNLTATERRTFLALLANPSISAVARAERVSRAAIYARLRGSRGALGMVEKNPFVAAWWERRRHNSDDYA